MISYDWEIVGCARATVRARYGAGLFQRDGAIPLRLQILLHFAIHLESTNRVVVPNDRDYDVAFTRANRSLPCFIDVSN
jgi:hypothetical protein